MWSAISVTEVELRNNIATLDTLNWIFLYSLLSTCVDDGKILIRLKYLLKNLDGSIRLYRTEFSKSGIFNAEKHHIELHNELHFTELFFQLKWMGEKCIEIQQK